MTNPLKWRFHEIHWSAFSELCDSFGSPCIWTIKVDEDGWFLVDGSDVFAFNQTAIPRAMDLASAKAYCQNAENEIVSDLKTKESAEAKYGKDWLDEPGC
jgi:hypothetical protein